MIEIQAPACWAFQTQASAVFFEQMKRCRDHLGFVIYCAALTNILDLPLATSEGQGNAVREYGRSHGHRIFNLCSRIQGIHDLAKKNVRMSIMFV